MSSKKAVLQSVCNNYEDLISVTGPHNAEYADKIGFDYILHSFTRNSSSSISVLSEYNS